VINNPKDEFVVIKSPLNIGLIKENDLIAVGISTYSFLTKVKGVQESDKAKTEEFNTTRKIPIGVLGVSLAEILTCNPELDLKMSKHVYADLPQEEIYELVFKKINQKPSDRAGATEILCSSFTAKNNTYVTREDKLSEVWIYENGIYVPNGKTYVEEYCRKILGRNYTTQLTNLVIDKIVADNYVNASDFFNVGDPYRLALQNGVFDFRKGELCEFNPKEVHFNKINAAFDEKADCPKIKEFIAGITSSPEDADLLFEIIAFCLIREYFLEKAFMFIGGGRNGKGKFISLIEKLLGSENTVNVSLDDLESKGYMKSDLLNKMANLGADISDTPIKKSGQFKELTGRDRVGADRKFKNAIYFQNFAKMIYSCNDLPITYDKSSGFFKRWVLVEFPFEFLPQKEIDSKYGKKIPKTTFLENTELLENISTPEELSGLFNICVKKIKELQKQKSFSYSKNSTQVQQLWVTKSDSLTGFFETCIKDEYEATIEKNDFRKAYEIFVRKHKVEKQSDVKIKKFFDLKGVYSEESKAKGEYVSRWRNISWNTDSEEALQILNDLKINTTPELIVQGFDLVEDRIRKTIEIMPTNNQSFLFTAFGEKVINDLVTKGVLYEPKTGSIKVV
jgi:P4 family phage/plasmid primase-like protien